jgi:MFS family permease
MDDLSAILFIISIVGLILSTPLLLYYGQSLAWESIFIICITFGIIACIILIYLRTPDLEHIEPIIQPLVQPIVYTDINTGINDVDKTVETVEDFDAIFQEV